MITQYFRPVITLALLGMTALTGLALVQADGIKSEPPSAPTPGEKKGGAKSPTTPDVGKGAKKDETKKEESNKEEGDHSAGPVDPSASTDKAETNPESKIARMDKIRDYHELVWKYSDFNSPELLLAFARLLRQEEPKDDSEETKAPSMAQNAPDNQGLNKPAETGGKEPAGKYNPDALAFKAKTIAETNDYENAPETLEDFRTACNYVRSFLNQKADKKYPLFYTTCSASRSFKMQCDKEGTAQVDIYSEDAANLSVSIYHHKDHPDLKIASGPNPDFQRITWEADAGESYTINVANNGGKNKNPVYEIVTNYRDVKPAATLPTMAGNKGGAVASRPDKTDPLMERFHEIHNLVWQGKKLRSPEVLIAAARILIRKEPKDAYETLDPADQDKGAYNPAALIKQAKELANQELALAKKDKDENRKSVWTYAINACEFASKEWRNRSGKEWKDRNGKSDKLFYKSYRIGVKTVHSFDARYAGTAQVDVYGDGASNLTLSVYVGKKPVKVKVEEDKEHDFHRVTWTAKAKTAYVIRITNDDGKRNPNLYKIVTNCKMGN